MKKLLTLLIVCMFVFLLTGCSPQAAEVAALDSQKQELTQEIIQLEEQKSMVENQIAIMKGENGLQLYVVTFEIKQSHFTLDIGEHLKDSMNKIELEIPVDYSYYESVEVGSVINDDFRMGSLLFKSSLGSWDITVTNKEIR